MSKIQIVDLHVTGDTEKFSDSLKFEVHFECIEPVKEAIEFKVVYVGKADDNQYDQELDKVELDDVPVGMFKFTLECSAPDSGKIPPDDLLGVTVILICGSYKGKEFVRVGYYVHVTYEDQALIEDPPLFPVYEKLTRQLMVDAPRVTHFAIPWDDVNTDDFIIGTDEADPIRQYMKDANEYMKEMEARLDASKSANADEGNGDAQHLTDTDTNPINNGNNMNVHSNIEDNGTNEDQFMLF
ncbi:hypothetical protein GJ496_009676 [Pomphorhynchus laevis]|nr:hypothetical protein GJ496_009676 [Pomphorhynchus laevis]